MKPAFFFIILTILISSCQQRAQDDVRMLLEDQVEAWNRGDIEGYMKGYWESDDLMFVSGGSVLTGYHPVLERYKKAYATPERMGKLTFSELAIRELSSDAMIVTGEWRLLRSGDEPWGRFTLLVQRKAEGWRITYDHTSAAQD